MEQLTDTIHETPRKPIYADIATRFGAAMLDGLILTPITMGLTYYSLIYAKSYALSLVPSLITLLYKCFMEKNYGATFGKKIIGIKVVTENLQELSYEDVFKRNYYYILAIILVTFNHYILYNTPGLESVTTYMEAMQFQMKLPLTSIIISYMLSLLFCIDCFFMINHERKQTLHDRWAKTVGVKADSI